MQAKENTKLRSLVASAEEFRRELLASKEKEVALEGRLAQRESINAEMKKKLEEMKRREADRENDLANARFVVAKLKNGKNKDGMNCLDFQELLELSDQRDDNDMDFEMLLSAQQLMSIKDVVNKANRNRLFVFSTSDKLSSLAAQHRFGFFILLFTHYYFVLCISIHLSCYYLVKSYLLHINCAYFRRE